MSSTSTVIDTKEGIEMFQLLALRGALKLEMVGMKRRGRSAASIVKANFGFKGSKPKLLAQLEAVIHEKGKNGIQFTRA